jgi:Dyp-type peroxidase family
MLDLTNIQGNILRGYASFPCARFLFLEIHETSHARRLVQRLVDEDLVTPAQWRAKPDATLNIAISFDGLRALGLPEVSLATFPAEFQEGMKQRAKALGDVGCSSPEHWDPPWGERRVHILLMMYGRTGEALDAHCEKLRGLLPDGVRELDPDQPAGRLRVNGNVTTKEHFGFDDGLSNPDIQGAPENAASRRQDIGNPDSNGQFRKIPLGEFLLGNRGEGGETAPMPLPHSLSNDATYLVFRKLEQDVPQFRDYLEAQAEAFTRALSKDLPANVYAKDFLAAKMMGRWADGSSLVDYPYEPAGNGPDQSPGNAFGYAQDPAGARCPLGAHVRRANPRDSLGFGGKTMSRHRLIRRGIPYGDYLPHGEQDKAKRGIIFMAFNSGLDQFEFVQQNWINNGDDFEQGNDGDPVVGSRGTGQMVIPGDEATGRRPYVCFDIPRFVTMKGGDYFFVPSLSGLSVLASGPIEVS